MTLLALIVSILVLAACLVVPWLIDRSLEQAYRDGWER